MAFLGQPTVLSLTSGGIEVVLDCEHFEIPIVAGARSPRASFTVSNEASIQLDRWSAGQRADIGVLIDTVYLDGGLQTLRQRFVGLRLIEKTEAPDPWNTTWILADRRYPWERRKLFYRFNVTRHANAATIAPQTSGVAVDWDLVKQWRYMPGQLKQKGAFAFNDTKTRDDPYATAEPWTALAAARKVLSDLGVTDGELQVELEDNGVVVENMLFNGDSAPSIIDALLAHARAGLTWLPQLGKFVIYSQAIDNPAVQSHGGRLFSMLGLVEDGGWPIRQDLRAMAPEKYRYHIQPDYEIRFSYDEQQPSKTALAFTLQNVVKLPENVTFEGKFYAAGTYVPLDDAIDMWIADEAPILSSNFEVSVAELRRDFFVGKVMTQFVSQLHSNDGSDKWIRRWTLLTNSYRKLFRIHPDWMDRIEAWQPSLSSVADPVTGHRVRSRVIMDYVFRPTVRGATGEKTRAEAENKGGLQVANWFADIKDVKDSPFWIKIINHDLGVFAIEEFHDMEGLEDWYYPGRVDDIPSLNMSSDETWQFAKLADEFKLDVVLSVILSEPSDASRFLVLERETSMTNASGSKTKGNGIVQDVFVFDDHARYQWTNETAAAIDAAGKLRIEGAKLLPQAEQTITAVVDALQARFEETWAERVSGKFTVPGFDPALHRPIGPMNVVVFSFDAESGAWTSLQIDDRTPPPSLREKLPPSVRAFVYHEAGRDALMR